MKNRAFIIVVCLMFVLLACYSEVQSDVMYWNPNQPNPDIYHVSKDFDIHAATNISLRIKTQLDTSFIIWVELTIADANESPFCLGLVPGGTSGGYVQYGWFAYYYLGPGYTDGKWHSLDLNLDEILQEILGVGLNSIGLVSLGGLIWIDDLSFY